MISTNSCPHCNSNNFIKYGKYNNLQRFKCKNCYKTFNEGTGLIWHNSRKSTSDWHKYFILMLQGHTIRSCARTLNMSIETSFKWRHKILNNLRSFTTLRRPSNIIALKHTKYKENFKGQKIPPVTIPMSSRKNVHILTTINKSNFTFTNISFMGNVLGFKELSDIKAILSPKSSDIFLPGLDTFSVKIAKYINKNKIFEIDTNQKKNLLLSCTNFLFKIRRWMKKFRSVATKYLNSYLCWFIYIYENSFNNHTMLSNLINSIFCTKVKIS